MIVLSLFDGISCANYILEKLGFNIEKYYSAEIDKHAIEVSNKNYPNQIRFGDVRNWKEWDIDFSKIDLIMAGSPCQSFSVAGSRKGFEGESGIIEVFFDILRYIKTLNPNVKFFLENVKMKKEWEEIINEELGVEPLFLNSSDFSAQQRKRLYWFNWKPEYQIKGSSDKCVNDILEDCISYKDKSYAITTTYQNLVWRDSLEKCRRNFVAKPVRVCDIGNGGQGQRVYSVKGKSVSLTAKVGAKTGLYKIDLPDGDYEFRKLTPIECERLQGLPDNYTDCIPKSHRYKVLGNSWQCDTIEAILKTLKI